MALASQQQSPVRFFAPDDVRLPRRLATYLKEQIEQRSETVLHGQLSQDHYKQTTGEIMGLKLALAECERITEEITG